MYEPEILTGKWLTKWGEERGGMLVKVKFLGATNFRGARYKATLSRGHEPEHQFTATVSASYSGEDDYLTACLEVLKKFEEWRNTDRADKFEPLQPWAKGYDSKTGDYSFVCI